MPIRKKKTILNSGAVFSNYIIIIPVLYFMHLWFIFVSFYFFPFHMLETKKCAKTKLIMQLDNNFRCYNERSSIGGGVNSGKWAWLPAQDSGSSEKNRADMTVRSTMRSTLSLTRVCYYLIK